MIARCVVKQQRRERRFHATCFPRARDAAAGRYHVTDRRAELNARAGSSPHTCRWLAKHDDFYWPLHLAPSVFTTSLMQRIHVLKYSTGSLLLILVSVPPIRKFTLSLVYLWPSGVKEYVGPLNKFGLGLLASSLPCCRCPLFANPYNPSIPSLPPHPLFPIFPLRTEHFLGVCKDQRLLYASFSTFIYSEIKVPLIRRFRGQKMSNYNVFKISWAPDRSSPPPG